MDRERCRDVGSKLMEVTGAWATEELSDEQLKNVLGVLKNEFGLEVEEIKFLRGKLPLWWNGWGSPERVR